MNQARSVGPVHHLDNIPERQVFVWENLSGFQVNNSARVPFQADSRVVLLQNDFRTSCLQSSPGSSILTGGVRF
ncbi:hypothetical protein IEQ34_010649 [Dendrobium chrysotoxum]|uniref:Uncharacterized protein n=1 Tax=Dendrobium chrysotoxum TaxID=161865 RepID=A0AAV7GTH2_DENCH|nr:hypothetical protein IEQ34_010649 [Dendrobium chrysotoxum]